MPFTEFGDYSAAYKAIFDKTSALAVHIGATSTTAQGNFADYSNALHNINTVTNKLIVALGGNAFSLPSRENFEDCLKVWCQQWARVLSLLSLQAITQPTSWGVYESVYKAVFLQVNSVAVNFRHLPSAPTPHYGNYGSVLTAVCNQLSAIQTGGGM